MFTSNKKGAKCDGCGEVLRRTFRRIPTCGVCTNGKPAGRCVHLGEQVGAPVKVKCAKGSTQTYHVHQCAARGRCLPGYRPNGEALKLWHERKPESDLFALCWGCPEKTTARDAASCEGTSGRDR